VRPIYPVIPEPRVAMPEAATRSREAVREWILAVLYARDLDEASR